MAIHGYHNLNIPRVFLDAKMMNPVTSML